MSNRKHWPFKVLPPGKRSTLHSAQIQFLESAFSKGFRPYVDDLEHGATGSDGRAGFILQRGSRNRWQLLIRADEHNVLSVFLDDFGCAAAALLRWLDGVSDRDQVYALCQNHLLAVKSEVEA